jgi:nitroreductase
VEDIAVMDGGSTADARERGSRSDVDQLLATTRSARKTLDLETPVDLAEVAECLRIGLQAPNGTNNQSWRWIVVADAARRRRVAALYREAYESMTGGGRVSDLVPVDTEFGRLMSSTEWLVEHLGEVPLFVIPCFEPYLPRTEGDQLFYDATLYGSIFPAVWNFQLALRSRGYGSCITTLHLLRAAEVAAQLDIPDTHVQGCLLPVARLRVAGARPAARKPLDEVTALDRWDGPPLTAGRAVSS